MANTATVNVTENQPLQIYVMDKRLDYESQYVYSKAADTEIIDKEKIADLRADSVPDILRNVSGFSLDYMGIGNKYNLNLRGYSSKPGVLVLVDGVPQNDINNDSILWESIPIDNIERIEIIRGGSSAIYGAGAVGGVINIVTQKPTDKLSGKALAGYNEKNSYWYDLRFSLPLNLVPVYLETDTRLETDKGFRANSAADSLYRNYSVTYKPLKQTVLAYSYKEGFANSLLPGPLTYDEYLNSPNISHYDDKENYKEKNQENIFTYKQQLAPFNLVYTAYAKKREQLSRNDQNWFASTANMQKNGQVVQAEYPLDFPGTSHRLIFGLENIEDCLINNDTYNVPTATFKARTSAAFLSDQINFGDVLLMEGDLRQDNIHYEYTNLFIGFDSFWNSLYESGEKNFSSLSPALGATLFPNSSFSPYINYNRSFKTMPFEDFAVFSPSYNANTSINPQINETVETGLALDIFDGLHLKFNQYWSRVVDEILFNDFTKKNENFNTRHYGYSIKMEFQLADVICQLGYEKDQGVLESSALSTTKNNMQAGDTLPNIPDYVLHANLKYYITKEWTATLLGKYVGACYAVNDFSQTGRMLQPYSLFDLIINYRQGGFSLFLKVENLTDTKYSAYSVYGVSSGNQHFYPGTPRNIQWGAGLEF
ncbi:MAG: TonB-dependent receptor [Candidatus Margulisbacteria bacterium]|nr:TonB-dependent receptor [Candidatus Margulisiibacteriota bacterium]